MEKKVKTKKKDYTEEILEYEVTFHVPHDCKLTNAISKKEEKYSFFFRDDMVEHHYFIVKLKENRLYSIEYKIYSLDNFRFDPSRELTLKDFMKSEISLNPRNYHPETTWCCPDTNEKFSYSEIIKIISSEMDEFMASLTKEYGA